jgi:hypothetical protein
MTSKTQTEAETPETAAAQEPKDTKTANVRAQGRRVAPGKGKSRKKATSAKKGPKSQKLAKGASGTREGSKTAKILDLLKRPGGGGAKELQKATGWLPHSVCGFFVAQRS